MRCVDETVSKERIEIFRKGVDFQQSFKKRHRELFDELSDIARRF
jgi:hypothetical protein